MKRYSHQSASNFNRGGFRARTPKRLDPALFVKKAALIEEAPYQSKHTFSDFAFHEAIGKAIRARTYTTPTPIQDQSIPLLLEGKDVVGIAATGTGKTAAFLLPLIHKVLRNRQERVLIIAPTRELASQIEAEFRRFSFGMNLSSAVCIGGVGMGGQIYSLRRNPSFVIGTPGRLKDLEQQRNLSFGVFQSLVLDEVDRMLDMGFLPDVQYIVSRLPKAPRQNIFFSATMTQPVTTVIQGISPQAVQVTIAKSASTANVDQDIVKVQGKPKVDVLHQLLQQEGFDKVLVFGRTKRGMDKLAQALNKLGVAVAAIHGNKSQHQRERALSQFKGNRVQVLLATDVASRGLDIDSVTHVINYDPPESYDDYIHRIGRTGRADKKGIALTFVD